MVHLNPDHFLQTPQGRVTTAERNVWAWAKCHAALPPALAAAPPGTRLYLMIGAQASGKTSWAKALKAREPGAVIFDAILVKRAERAPILAVAQQYGVPAVAVWLRTPLEVCLARNGARPADEVADERGLRNVFAALEPPELDEGFAEILQA